MIQQLMEGAPRQVLDSLRDAAGAVGGAVGASGSQSQGVLLSGDAPEHFGKTR